MKLKAPTKREKKLKADVNKWTARQLSLADKKNNAEVRMKSTMQEVFSLYELLLSEGLRKNWIHYVSQFHRLAVRQIGQMKEETSMKNLVAICGTAWQYLHVTGCFVCSHKMQQNYNATTCIFT